MKKRKTNLVIFSIGACGYGLLEILWRGYTHWSMLTAGGIAFLGLSRIANGLKNVGIFVKSILGGALITAIEYVFGIIFNVVLKRNVWDYSKLPLNIGGQICALYSAIWVLISLIGIPLSGKLCRSLEKGRR